MQQNRNALLEPQPQVGASQASPGAGDCPEEASFLGDTRVVLQVNRGLFRKIREDKKLFFFLLRTRRS